jgi:hypothetical protein
MRTIYVIFFQLIAIPSFSQTNTKPTPAKTSTTTAVPPKLIQFSGIVIQADSLHPIPFSAIITRHTSRGTISDYSGYFSFVAQKKDTIEFSAIGFKKGYFIIPDTLSTDKYSLIQALVKDTTTLAVADVYPWPSRDQFKQAFINKQIPDDDLQHAKENLARAELKELQSLASPDANLNYKVQMQYQYNKLYYAGQLPSNNLLNPLAWAKFIQAWKNGDFNKR